MQTSIELAALLQASAYPSVNYLGDFPANGLPERLPRERRAHSLIVNSDPAGLPGQHWMAICVLPDRRGCLFIEPLGTPLDLLLPPLRAWLAQHHPIERLPYQIQPATSAYCGVYCAYCLAHLPHYNYRLDELVRQEFSEENLLWNDAKMRRFYYKRLAAAD